MAEIRLGVETGGLPVITPIKTQEKDSEENDVESSQVVINMTMRDWKVFGKQICVLSKL